MGELKINYQYPYHPDYEFKCRLERINLDEERTNDILSGNGFIVSEPKSIKKDISDINTIFSTRFGQTLTDVNAFANRYKCKCGNLTSRINHGIKCPICHERVKYLDDDFGYFGWIVIKGPYYLIHPNLYKSIENLIGSTRLNNIICPVDEKDENGFEKEVEKPKDEPFFGIGMIDFKERFNEILDYYVAKYPTKLDTYNDILANQDKVFIQSIPVYTTHLRPFRVESEKLIFEGTNATYNILAKCVSHINRNQLKIDKKAKPKKKLLYDAQLQYNSLYKEIEDTLAQKKGVIRSLFGGRYNFSSRSVIVPGPDLRIDQVRLPYHGLVELLQQTIINVLQKTLNCSYSDAHKIWYKAQIKPNQRVHDIIEYIIKDSEKGIPIIINRNPSINYGSLLQMYVVGINDNYTMSIPLQILKPLAADFDGDTLNILYLINKPFIERAEKVLNPRNAMYISRNDGRFNNDVNFSRDCLINANTMIYLSRYNYKQEQLEKIKRIKAIKE